MIIQNNGKRKFLIDGLVIEPQKTYKITDEQYNRIKGFKEIKPLCVINSQKSADKKQADKGKDKSNSKSADKKQADKGKDTEQTNIIDNDKQPNNNK